MEQAVTQQDALHELSVTKLPTNYQCLLLHEEPRSFKTLVACIAAYCQAEQDLLQAVCSINKVDAAGTKSAGTELYICVSMQTLM